MEGGPGWSSEALSGCQSVSIYKEGCSMRLHVRSRCDEICTRHAFKHPESSAFVIATRAA